MYTSTNDEMVYKNKLQITNTNFLLNFYAAFISHIIQLQTPYIKSYINHTRCALHLQGFKVSSKQYTFFKLESSWNHSSHPFTFKLFTTPRCSYLTGSRCAPKYVQMTRIRFPVNWFWIYVATYLILLTYICSNMRRWHNIFRPNYNCFMWFS